MEVAIDLFAMAMKTKIRRKTRQGYSGGLTQEARVEVMSKLHEHTQKAGPYCDGQEVDIANLAMMLWFQRYRLLLLEIYDTENRA